MEYRYKNIIETDATTIEEAREKVARTYLGARLEDRAPTQSEIDALMAELEAMDQEEDESSTIEGQITGEITWLNANIQNIADPIVKRLAQQNLGMFRVMRFLIRRAKD